ncbi:stage VI sporulation protein F [Brevibacillus ruminantium]|uniref:Stage VI sporulation protein F n=1 Tax=Brevibacillus ruminantium TaxID=2950604 RepID=A0ABY4W973_9BACL|nr:stage VI sporulation protein F [Brevibacillus ruminantium]USG63718.1 stage VI sporulation protein F [Brevibacillus ruminantium]
MPNPNDLLKKINEKSKKNLSMDDIKSLARGYKKKDFQDDQKLKELIKKVGKAVGIPLSDDQISKVRKEVKNKIR